METPQWLLDLFEPIQPQGNPSINRGELSQLDRLEGMEPEARRKAMLEALPPAAPDDLDAPPPADPDADRARELHRRLLQRQKTLDSIR